MIDAEKASFRVRVHAGFEIDLDDPGLVGRLRPFSGISDREIADLLQALVVLHPAVVASATIARDTCAALWSICDNSRVLVLRDGSPIRRNGLMTNTELNWFGMWIDGIERFSIRMLCGLELAQCISSILELIAARQFRDVRHFRFLVPMLRLLNRCDDQDVAEYARSAMAVLSGQEEGLRREPNTGDDNLGSL